MNKENKQYEKRISFVMPCYNDGDTIEKAIKSIRDQDLPGIEIIVVNDCSPDNAKTILNNLKDFGLIDEVIHLEKNMGACIARNEGAKIAKGKYLSFLPADAILYPGVARNWYEVLEDNPDYDFMYGGYRFVDDEGESLAGQDYGSAPFDPYLLEVTNYIDGSFPIKAESFWKYAMIMNQPDGLWDPKVKSLQDWDFWLSVVKNGGKGVFVQDIFFGTTIPHPGGLSYDSAQNWIERTDFIKRKQGIPDRKLCVASLGAGWHAKRIAYMLGADFKEMPSFKPHKYDALYVIGFYPEFAQLQGQMFQENMLDTSKGLTGSKKIIHFVGSDIFQFYHVSINALKFYHRYFHEMNVKILCEADFTKKELKELGFEAEVVPIPPAKLYEVKSLPNDFIVACYQPLINENFYRPAEMLEVAKAMPDIKFKFFGNPKKLGLDATASNVEYCGYVDNMEPFIQECSAIMRFPQHDGLPLTVLEFTMAGRYSVQNVPIEYTYYLENFDVNNAVKALRELQEKCKVGPNVVGSEFWRKELNHEKFKKTIESFYQYDPKKYWEDRAKDWSDTATITQPTDMKQVKEALSKLNIKSVLDVGCGDGRWYPVFKDLGVERYRGIDISENLIKAAQIRFPHLKDNFITSKLEDFKSEEKADVVFSYTCLEHITEAEFPKAVEAIKKLGKKLVLVEPVNFTSRYYCHCHEYEKFFKVIEKVEVDKKVLMICDLEA